MLVRIGVSTGCVWKINRNFIRFTILLPIFWIVKETVYLGNKSGKEIYSARK